MPLTNCSRFNAYTLRRTDILVSSFAFLRSTASSTKGTSVDFRGPGLGDRTRRRRPPGLPAGFTSRGNIHTCRPSAGALTHSLSTAPAGIVLEHRVRGRKNRRNLATLALSRRGVSPRDAVARDLRIRSPPPPISNRTSFAGGASQMSGPTAAVFGTRRARPAGGSAAPVVLVVQPRFILNIQAGRPPLNPLHRTFRDREHVHAQRPDQTGENRRDVEPNGSEAPGAFPAYRPTAEPATSASLLRSVGGGCATRRSGHFPHFDRNCRNSASLLAVTHGLQGREGIWSLPDPKPSFFTSLAWPTTRCRAEKWASRGCVFTIGMTRCDGDGSWSAVALIGALAP